MIQMESYVNVCDNSGIKIIKCIKILGGSWRREGGIGDVIIASVQSKQKYKIFKTAPSKIQRAVIVSTKSPIRRLDGMRVLFGSNSAVLLTIKDKVVAKRVSKPVARELRMSPYRRVFFLARKRV